jgi:hypothetical protein
MIEPVRRARQGLLIGAVTLTALLALSAAASARTITVDTLDGSAVVDGNCALPEAITAANEDAPEDTCRRGDDADTIVFDIAAPGSLISPTAALPPITERVVLDGGSEPDPGTDRITLDGDSAGGANGLTVQAGRTTIRGFIVIDFALDGINIAGGRNKVLDCRVGTSSIVSSAGNGNQGIDVVGNRNRIGGGTSATGNLVSANTQEGVLVEGTGNVIRNNLVGTIANGGSGLGNGLDGVEVEGEENVVGPGNVVSANGLDGIDLEGRRHVVRGNIVGLTADGEVSLGNGSLNGAGIAVFSSRSVIGGDEVADRNVISGNEIEGVEVHAGANRNRILGNFIGVDDEGDELQGNGDSGIALVDASDNTIGGKGAGNRIVDSGNDGIEVTGNDSLRNSFLRNSIHSNGELGIDLGADGVTDNDLSMNGPHDTDIGANGLQNFPEITELGPAAGRIAFNLLSKPNARFRVEAFASDSQDPSEFGEGQRFIGAKVVRTNAAGAAAGVLRDDNPQGDPVALTATRLGPNDDPRETSEFGRVEQDQ